MLARFFGLPHGLELLESNIHDQYAPPNGELAMLRLKGMLIILISLLDPKSPWGTSIDSKHWPITAFIKLGTFCCHKTHNHS